MVKTKVIDAKCPSCQAPIKFNPSLGKFKCEFCESVFNASDIKDMNEEKNRTDEESVNYVNYNCPDCGAEIISDENTSATFCVYCGNTSIIKSRLTGKFAPSKIIPFKKTKEDAIEAFKSLKKGRRLIPKGFIDEKNIEKIRGIYIPFWLYDLNISGGVVIDAKKVDTWRRGDTQYTKTDYFNVIRDGNMSFYRVPVDGSTRFDNDIMNSIEPFNYSELEDYNHAYLSGFLAEKYDVESDQAIVDAKSRSINSAKNEMLSSAVGYSSKIIANDNLEAEEVKHEYVLLPVYMVNIKYNEKMYTFAMNGETGEFVGNIPIDKKKTVIFFLSIFAISFLVIFIIAYIIHEFGGV